MNVITLTTAYLTVIPAIAFAQLQGSDLSNDSNSSITVQIAREPTLSDHKSDEYALRNNLPFFPGGSPAIQAYFQNLKLYPDQVRTATARGKVGVLFRVMPSGQLTEFRIVQSQGPLLDHAALEAVALMPRWFPAHREGVAVSCLYQLLITFNPDSD